MSSRHHIGARLLWSGIFSAVALGITLGLLLCALQYRERHISVAESVTRLTDALADSLLEDRQQSGTAELQAEAQAETQAETQARVEALFTDPSLVHLRVTRLPDIQLADLGRHPEKSSLRGLTSFIFGSYLRHETLLDPEAAGQPALRISLIYDRHREGMAFLQDAIWNLAWCLLLALCVMAVTLMVVRHLLMRPINQLTAGMERITPAKLDEAHVPEMPGHQDDELGLWVKAANHLLDSMRYQQAARRSMEREMQEMADHDRLTGLANRNRYYQDLEQACNRARKNGTRVCALYCDLREFHHINDEHGIRIGDQLLNEAGHRLTRVLADAGTIARLGGDRFAIMLNEVSDLDDVRGLCKSLLRCMQSPFSVDGTDIRLNIAIGVAVYPDDAEDVEPLSQDAEKALTLAKQNKGSHYQFYYSELGDVVRNQQRMLRDLEQALMREELSLRYQPQFELGSGDLVAVEALVRWDHPILGKVSPGVFIPLAEEQGLIDEIGDWVLGRACHEAVCWSACTERQASPAPVLAINVSARQLNGSRLKDRIIRHLRASGLPPQRLELEITETAVMEDIEQARENLQALSDLGVRIAIDDFGTGQASLQYLRKLPLDKLKIDQGFIREICSSQEAETIVRTIVTLGRGLDLEVLAEGVETEAQVAVLKGLRCHLLQGYLLSHPLKSGQLGNLLSGRQQLDPALQAQLVSAPPERRQISA